MGFGLDRKVHAARLWTFPVLFHIEDGFSAVTCDALMRAMADWGNGVNRGPMFTPVHQPGPGVVIVKKLLAPTLGMLAIPCTERIRQMAQGPIYFTLRTGQPTIPWFMKSVISWALLMNTTGWTPRVINIGPL